VAVGAQRNRGGHDAEIDNEAPNRSALLRGGRDPRERQENGCNETNILRRITHNVSVGFSAARRLICIKIAPCP
jgi:hypothetical protein